MQSYGNSSYQKRDIYQDVTNNIIGALANPGSRCELPWHQDGSIEQPKNALTENPYSGINTVALWAASMKLGYRSEWWATYKQWQLLGAHVRKGQKGSPIIFYKEVQKPKHAEDDKGSYRIARSYSVFNSEQVEGFSQPASLARNLVEIVKEAETVVKSTNAEIFYKGTTACYHTLEDYIQMPPRELFLDTPTRTATEGFYAVLFHELTHWTRHPDRLDRKFTHETHKENYAMEELVAELGAAFLCSKLSITNEPREDHAQYIGSWLKALQNDKKAIFKAASLAAKASEYLMEGQNRPQKAKLNSMQLSHQ